jgi:hypothetical protein
MLAMDAPLDYLNPYTAILALYIATFLYLILIGGEWDEPTKQQPRIINSADL